MIFISHSHSPEDVRWVNEVRKHLRTLERRFDVEIWDKTEIDPPTLWEFEAEEAIGRAKVIIVLISKDYFSSDYITDFELPLILRVERERESFETPLIIPLIINDSPYLETELGQLYPANGPYGSLDVASPYEQSEIFERLAFYVAHALNLLLHPRLPQSVANALPAPPSTSSYYPDEIETGPLVRILRNIFIAVLIVGFIASLAWLAPRIGSPILRPKGTDNFQLSDMPMSLQGTSPNRKKISGTLSIRIPKSVKVSETLPISAQFKPDSEQVYTLSTVLKLESPSFKITPTDNSRMINPGPEFLWGWLILPETTGRHAVSLRFEPDIEYQLDQNRRPVEFEMNSNSIIAYINVLTDLNLTSTQDTILKIIGGLIGIVGTILGYPFLKRRFGSG